LSLTQKLSKKGRFAKVSQFHLLRLRKSSLSELIYRAKQFYFLKKLKRQISENKNPVAVPKINHEDLKDLELPALQWQINKNLIQKIIGGELFALNTDISVIGKFEKNHRQVFFADIKYSDRQPDIRALWEPARLQHLVILMKYISQIKESFYTDEVEIIERFVKDSVINWIHDNPFSFGPHYISAMECGLRVPVFFYFLKSIDNLDVHEYQLILDTIYKHGWLISKRLSLYSSLGNHTITESVGLTFAGAVFRNTKEGQKWLNTGRELLKQELYYQIKEDGGPAEHSFNYHRFILDLYWFAINFLEKNNLYKCGEFKERLKQGERFIGAFEDVPNGMLPTIGDSDDGHAIAPGIHPRKTVPDKKNKKLQTFPTSGYTIINSINSVLTFDHGPLGMPPLYNHGHADALSVTLSVYGKEMLVDPGTYRYNGEPEFRKYFKGTRAHNTITIDGLDQAVQDTSFIWSQPYKAKLVKSVEENGDVFLKAEHDGYMIKKEPVRHSRAIYNYDGINFLVKDTFSGKGIHTFELNYHLHPDSQIVLENNGWWKIDRQGAVIYIRLLNSNNFDIIKGQRDPLFGWYSPMYGIKHESGVLNCVEKGAPQSITFTTAICIHSPKLISTLAQRFYKFEKQVENS